MDGYPSSADISLVPQLEKHMSRTRYFLCQGQITPCDSCLRIQECSCTHHWNCTDSTRRVLTFPMGITRSSLQYSHHQCNNVNLEIRTVLATFARSQAISHTTLSQSYLSRTVFNHRPDFRTPNGQKAKTSERQSAKAPRLQISICLAGTGSSRTVLVLSKYT